MVIIEKLQEADPAYIVFLIIAIIMLFIYLIDVIAQKSVENYWRNMFNEALKNQKEVIEELHKEVEELRKIILGAGGEK